MLNYFAIQLGRAMVTIAIIAITSSTTSFATSLIQP